LQESKQKGVLKKKTQQGQEGDKASNATVWNSLCLMLYLEKKNTKILYV